MNKATRARLEMGQLTAEAAGRNLIEMVYEIAQKSNDNRMKLEAARTILPYLTPRQMQTVELKPANDGGPPRLVRIHEGGQLALDALEEVVEVAT